MKPLIYTEVVVLKITLIQKQTLEKLKVRNVKVSDFIRKAIAEKIKRDAKELEVKPKKVKYPF
jgi:post-segregation antitoxin (ccd killing protein)